jgi:hypothetical protein
MLQSERSDLVAVESSHHLVDLRPDRRVHCGGELEECADVGLEPRLELSVLLRGEVDPALLACVSARSTEPVYPGNAPPAESTDDEDVAPIPPGNRRRPGSRLRILDIGCSDRE